MKTFFSIFLCCATAALLLLSGCKRDKCKNVYCEHGECVDGECVCTQGYGGPTCSDPLNQPFKGGSTYDLTESCTAGDDDYQVWFEAAAGTMDQIRVAGLWEHPEDTVVGVVEPGGASLVIGRQPLDDMEVEATGTIDGAGQTLTLTYKVYFPGNAQPLDACEASLEKQ